MKMHQKLFHLFLIAGLIGILSYAGCAKAQAKSHYITQERMSRDTLNYWIKRMSDNMQPYISVLPRRDTVAVYFEFAYDPDEKKNGVVTVIWAKGLAFRDKEVITGFLFYNQTISPDRVLIYKILK